MTSSAANTSESFLLISSDQQKISADPDLLRRYSNVFRDMLDFKSAEQECKVAETGSEISLMINALEGGTPNGCNKEEIRVLIKLADKYDSLLLMAVAKANLW